MSANCIFCKIIAGEAPGKIYYQDEEIVVIEDKKPASKHHYLSIPKQHIIDVNYLMLSVHEDLLKKLVLYGKKVLEDNGGDVNDVRLGFHRPPFNSVAHLHLHVISPVSEMSFLNRLIFKPDTRWFQTVDQILKRIDDGTSRNKL